MLIIANPLHPPSQSSDASSPLPTKHATLASSSSTKPDMITSDLEDVRFSFQVEEILETSRHSSISNEAHRLYLIWSSKHSSTSSLIMLCFVVVIVCGMLGFAAYEIIGDVLRPTTPDYIGTDTTTSGRRLSVGGGNGYGRYDNIIKPLSLNLNLIYKHPISDENTTNSYDYDFNERFIGEISVPTYFENVIVDTKVVDYYPTASLHGSDTTTTTNNTTSISNKEKALANLTGDISNFVFIGFNRVEIGEFFKGVDEESGKFWFWGGWELFFV